MTAMRLGLSLAFIGTLAFVAAGCGDDGGTGGSPDGGGTDGAMADGGGSDGAAGDGGGGGVCDVAFTACGGDITGDWQVTHLCTDGFGPLAGITYACPGATLEVDATAAGTATFGASPGLDYMVDFDITATVSLEVPASCLGNDAGVPSTCDALEDAGVTCTGDTASGCSCTGMPTTSLTDSGTYTTTAGGDITLDSPTQGTSTSQYCVDGDSLRIYSDEVGTFVLERQ